MNEAPGVEVIVESKQAAKTIVGANRFAAAGGMRAQ